MPASVDEMHFPSYLRFVNREDQCDQCVEHFRAQFDGLNDAIIPTFDAVSMLKTRPLVTSAGGPGIGQSHLRPMITPQQCRRCMCRAHAVQT
jgi:hypothetical protein